MLLYSILFPIISILAILWFVYRYLKQKQSLITLILWTILWLFVILFSIFPRASEQFARLFGITRGLDFIIIAVFVVLFYIIFGLFNRVDRLQDEINKIVKEVAINNEISLDDEEDEECFILEAAPQERRKLQSRRQPKNYWTLRVWIIIFWKMRNVAGQFY